MYQTNSKHTVYILYFIFRSVQRKIDTTQRPAPSHQSVRATSYKQATHTQQVTN